MLLGMRVLVEADRVSKEQGEGWTICSALDGGHRGIAADQGCSLKAPAV